MIPKKIVRFLEQYANLAFAGTRDGNLIPHGHRVSGWQVGADRRTLTAFVAESFTAGLIEALDDNGQFALTVEEFPSHETYQFKGTYLRHRPIQDADVAIVAQARQRFVKRLLQLEPDTPPAILRDYIQRPAIAIEFEVHDIFVQTPGPGAGTKLPLEAEA